MIRNFALIGLAWLWAWLVQGLDFAKGYGHVLTFTADYEISLIAFGTIGSICYVVFAYAMREFGLFSWLYFLNVLFFELGRFFICCISMLSIIFIFQLDLNLWKDLGFLVIIPFEVLLASCFGFYVFDFNYPISAKVTRNVGVAIFSFVVVVVSAAIFN